MRITIEPGIRLFVDIEGPGLVPDGTLMREKPTLILLHGGPGYDHSAFKPIFSRLADVVQIVYFDHRGHGRSDRRPPEEWTLDMFADDVVRLCEALGIVKPIVLGQSFGGFVAQRYLARHPTHPAKVVLSSTSHHLGLERKLVMFEKLGGARARAVAQAFWQAPGPATWAPYKAICSPLYNMQPPDDPQRNSRIIFNEEILFASAAGEQQSMNLLPGLAAVCCPVLVMAGVQDPVTPLQDAQDIAAAIPAPWGRLVTFASAGHGAWRDEPDAAMAALRDFILAP
jgi:pimeloyl-ACP methyl ester carboxylesterase